MATADEPDERVDVVPTGSAATRDAEFTAFVTRHQADLLRTAWLLVGDAHRAEELAQQALVRTYVSWPRARAGDPLAYARRVLVNLRTDTWRRRRREVLVPHDDMTDNEGQRDGRASDDETAAVADRDLLVRALMALSPRQRRIVVLRHVLDLPEAEVAAELGVSLGTVKSTASRALAQLRGRLGSDGADVTGSGSRRPNGLAHPPDDTTGPLASDPRSTR